MNKSREIFIHTLLNLASSLTKHMGVFSLTFNDCVTEGHSLLFSELFFSSSFVVSSFSLFDVESPLFPLFLLLMSLKMNINL